MSIQDLGLYQEQLLDHYKNPRCKGKIELADFNSGSYNPSCGDEIEITGTIADNAVETVVFEGQGCIISQAMASMLLEKAANQKLREILSWDDGYIKELISVDLGPTRLKCALLALDALQQGIKKYMTEQAEGR